MEDQRLASSMIDCYFGGARRGSQLVKHQLDSYNDFVSRKLEQIIEGFNTIDICSTYLPAHGCYQYVLSLSLSNPSLSKPIINEKDGSTKVMQPNDARLRNMTYAAPLTVELHVTAKTFSADVRGYLTETKRISEVSLGRVPVMVRSRYCMLTQAGSAPPAADECRYDYGGYFVINGSEKVVISQDRIAENSTYVFINTKASCYSHVAEIRSVQEARFSVPKTLTLKLASKANGYGRPIKLCMHRIRQDIPVFVMFRALGIESDRAIVDIVLQASGIGAGGPVAECLTTALAGCMNDSGSVQTTDAALAYLAQHLAVPQHQHHHQHQSASQQQASRVALARGMLRKDLLPHVGVDLLKKAVYLGYMVGRLLRCQLGLAPLDDRDSYINKRLDTPGVLLASLFRQYYGKVIKDMRMLVQKDLNGTAWRTTNKLINLINKGNVYKLIKPTVIEAGLRCGLATGNWGIKTSRVRQGVAQVLNRMTYVATLSHLRRINTPIEKTGKLVQPRKLHATQWGVVCPAETPEGASVGLVKNLALCATITVASSSDQVREVMGELGARLISAEDVGELRRVFAPGAPATRLFVNGDLVGTHDDAARLHAELKRLKRCGAISVFTSVHWDVLQQHISMCTEGGRFVRPLLVVRPDQELELDHVPGLRSAVLAGEVQWDQLVLSGAVEYLDVYEANCSLIAMTADQLRAPGGGGYTHLEMSPSAMLGVVAGSIPYSDHNQAPRNTYQSAMGKQAIGVYATNFRHRFDTMVHVLSYPQKPMVSTQIARTINCDELPCGTNAIVAIACFTGFNQEDSVIVNRSAVDRGLLVSTFYRTFREQNNKNHSTGEEEYFCRPDPATTRSLKPFNYAKVTESGFVEENTYVETGDIIIGKCMPQKVVGSASASGGGGFSNKDTSVALKSSERGYIDRNCYGNRNFTNVTGDGYTFAKVRMRQDRVPTIGDKVSSRHGQKGTIGMLYREEDMPFTTSGIVPSLIINPHAIPSRMTIGQLMEALHSKACAMTGCTGDATPFNGRTVEDIARELEVFGVERYGNELMYNPRTGEQVECAVFVCPTYYQRLKHMVEDKVHSRSANGPVVLLTRQPAEGRARDGGLRVGEMENECLLAHGSMFFLKERFMECSDNYRVFICRKCGMLATNANPERGLFYCCACKNLTEFEELRIPYACKLLLQEIQTMAIGTRFLT